MRLNNRISGLRSRDLDSDASFGRDRSARIQQRRRLRMHSSGRNKMPHFDPVETLATLIENNGWAEAVVLLKNLPCLSFIWRTDTSVVKRAWEAIETNTDVQMLNTYHTHLTQPLSGEPALLELAELLAESGHEHEAAELFDALIMQGEDNGHETLASSLDWRARLHWGNSEFDAAMDLLLQEERVCRKHNDIVGLAQTLNNLALLHEDRCEFCEAMDLLRKSEQLHRDLGDFEGLGMNMSNQARILFSRRQTSPALELLASVELYGQQSGNDELRARAFLLKAEIMANAGRLQDARDSAFKGHSLAKLIHHRPLMKALGELLE